MRIVMIITMTILIAIQVMLPILKYEKEVSSNLIAILSTNKYNYEEV